MWGQRKLGISIRKLDQLLKIKMATVSLYSLFYKSRKKNKMTTLS